MTGDGRDPKGDDNLLDWSVTASHPVSDTSTRTFVDQETFSTNYGTHSNNAHATIDVVLTNEHGLTDTARVGIQTYDPIVFDLNRDGQIDLIGGAMAEKQSRFLQENGKSPPAKRATNPADMSSTMSTSAMACMSRAHRSIPMFTPPHGGNSALSRWTPRAIGSPSTFTMCPHSKTTDKDKRSPPSQQAA